MHTWKPDTCECYVEEIYPVNPGDPITFGQVLAKCPAHASVPDNALYGVLYANPDGENRRKNQFLRIALGHEGMDFGLSSSKLDQNGSEQKELKDGLSYEWSFTGTGSNRVLRAKIKGATITQTQRNAFITLCDSKFGQGKVILE